MKEKKHKKERKDKKKRHRSLSGSSSKSEGETWVEKPGNRDDWMSMTGKFKTYTKDDVKPKQDVKDKKHIDSYNPSTSTRELNPYWKDGGTGVPLSPEIFRKSRPFIKPVDDGFGYSKSSSSRINESNKNTHNSKSYNWRKTQCESSESVHEKPIQNESQTSGSYNEPKANTATERYSKSSGQKPMDSTKMNKLAAKLVKAEILGDAKLVAELKQKLEEAREYMKNNPDGEDDSVLLLSTTSTGNSRPLIRNSEGDFKSRSGKRKVETHDSSGRLKYFGNDDKYDLKEMFQHEKYGSNFDDDAQLAKVASKSKNPNDDLEDIFLDDISKNKKTKNEDREKQQAIHQHKKLEKSLEGCEHCIDSKNMLKHLIINCGNKVYLALPAKRSLVKGQCIISTIQHSLCVTAVDEDIWEEILNFRNMVTQFFNSKNQDVVFFETATRLHRYPHMVINCVPLPRDVGDMASIYFKKALLECEAEWSMNKKVIDLKGKNIRKGVPKGLPYFWIDFGMDPGFAHVIEDQQLFPRNFAEEIIGGMLDLDHGLWKNPQKEYGDVQRKKVSEFVKEWKPFEKCFKETV